MRETTSMIKTAAAISFPIALCVLLSACPDDARSAAGDAATEAQPELGDGGCAKLDSSFAAIQKVIFERHGCTASACHGSAKSGKLDLRPAVAYKNLVDATATGAALARAQPGTAEESYLYKKLRAATEPGSVQIAGSPMPVGMAPLTKDELAAVALWILKGAPETGSVSDPVKNIDVGTLLNACLPPAKPVIVKPLEPPAPDDGIQFLLPTYLLKAKSELENCTQFAYDFTDRVPARFKDEAHNVMFVDGTRVRQDPQSHHLTLYNDGVGLGDLSGDLSGWTCREGAHADAACDPRKGSADCGDDGVCADVSVRTGGGCFSGKGLGQQIANTQSPQSYIAPRPGLYSKIPLKGVLTFNSHAFNLLDEDTTLHARVNFYYTDDLQRELVPVNVTSHLSIAAGQAPFTKKTYCATSVVPRGNSITLLAGHTHRRGERFWVMDPQGKMIYENFIYNDPLYKEFDPWLTFDEADAAQRTLKYCATYNNGLAEDGSPDLELVTRASRMPMRTSCKPVACVAGKITAACTSNADCDSTPGAGDGSCDACTITAGTTTENEMFVLMPWYALPEAQN